MLKTTSCVTLVDKLGKTGAQASRLYELYTEWVGRSWFFVRSPSTDGHVLNTVYTSRFSQNSSLKFSYTRFTQALLMQINKESY